MLKRLKYLKAAQLSFRRILHIPSSLHKSKSFQVHKDVSNAKGEPEVELHRTVPYVITGSNCRYKEGRTYEGFQCERIEPIPDYGLTSYTLRHLGTGTEFWYLDRNDIHNLFAINFRTPVCDSMGLPHILEHLVLGGSKKYPVRNAFRKMLQRSVSTFMNAMTAPDYTLYAFSSRNEVDFRNLQKIYMDAVFRPNLLHLDFLQEGWRLEYKDLYDRDTDLTIKGVVYNEMIGAFSDNSQLFRVKVVNNILPSHTYGHTSGGYPEEIPKLTHSDLVEFHRKYYHPSNARIFCYGSFDLEKTLAFVDKEYLSQYEYIDNAFSSIPPEDRWTEPRNVHIPCRLDPMAPSLDRQNHIAIGLLTCDITDVQESFELTVLSDVMIRGPNSAFYKSLIEPNFSGGYTKRTGYLPTCKDTYFLVGLRYLRADDFNRFNELFDHTVYKASKNGLDSEHIESVISHLELLSKQESIYFGKRLLWNSTALWINEGDVCTNLRVSEMVATLRRKLKENPNYFQQKIEKFFIKNTHKLTLTMSPNKLYDTNFKLSEARLLVQKLKEISDEEFDNIYKNGIKLETAQKATQNNDVLPCISISDVMQPMESPQMVNTTIQNVPTQLCKVFSNGITYISFFFNITGLSEDDAKLVPLFCNILSEMGTYTHDFRQFEKLVRSKMAPIKCNTRVVENVIDGRSYRLGLVMSTHCLDKNVSEMLDLCKEIMLNFNLEDTTRLKMLIENYISKLSLDIPRSGHLYAMLCSSGLVTNAAKLKSELAGVDQIDFMKEYVQQKSIEEIRDKLINIGSKVFSKSDMRVAINCSDAHQSTALRHYERFLQNLPILEKKIDDSKLYLLEPRSRHYFMNRPIGHCGKSFYAVPYVHKDHPVLRVLAKFIAAKYLVPVVREQNGAYGTSAKIGFDGLFSFYSYRDPHAAKTIKIFDKTSEWLQASSHKLDQQSLFEAKLGVLQLVDWPTGPRDIGTDNFVLGASYDIYTKYRSRVLAVTVDEVRTVIEKYFKQEPKHFGKCILGQDSEELEEARNQKVGKSL